MMDPREQGTEPLGSVKCGKSLGQPNDAQPLNKNSVPKRSKAERTKQCYESHFLLRTPPSETEHLNTLTADASGQAVEFVDLWPTVCWDCGFECCRGHGCLCLVSVVVC